MNRYSLCSLAGFSTTVYIMGFLGGSVERIRLPMKKTQEMWVQPPGLEDHLEEEMTTHSSILAWKIPGTVEPGGLQSTGSQRVGHN